MAFWDKNSIVDIITTMYFSLVVADNQNLFHYLQVKSVPISLDHFIRNVLLFLFQKHASLMLIDFKWYDL
jgi:hypothetical protein